MKKIIRISRSTSSNANALGRKQYRFDDGMKLLVSQEVPELESTLQVQKVSTVYQQNHFLKASDQATGQGSQSKKNGTLHDMEPHKSLFHSQLPPPRPLQKSLDVVSFEVGNSSHLLAAPKEPSPFHPLGLQRPILVIRTRGQPQSLTPDRSQGSHFLPLG